MATLQKRPPLEPAYANGPKRHVGCDEPLTANGLQTDDDLLKDVKDNDDTKESFLLIFLLFLAAVGIMLFVYLRFPNMSRLDQEKLKLPTSLEDAKDLGKVLSSYKEEYYLYVLLAFATIYVFLQTFAIPGSIFLSILAGFLFPFPLALFLVCLCSSLGASFCYTLSALVGKKLVKKYLPDRLAIWQKQIDHHRNDILNYMIFLRITPFLPNWFINISAPVLNVPLSSFFLGTFIGVAPPSFGFISAGFELYELTATGDAFSFKSISLVVISAVISIIPVLFRKKWQKKLE